MSGITFNPPAGSRKVALLVGDTGYYGLPSADPIRNARKASPSNWVAANFQTILSVAGAGVLKFAAVVAANTTIRTIGLRITIDGRVIYTNTASGGASLYALVGVGTLAGEDYSGTIWLRGVQEDEPFYSSLLIEASSSLSENAVNVAVFHKHEIAP